MTANEAVSYVTAKLVEIFRSRGVWARDARLPHKQCAVRLHMPRPRGNNVFHETAFDEGEYSVERADAITEQLLASSTKFECNQMKQGEHW